MTGFLNTNDSQSTLQTEATGWSLDMGTRIEPLITSGVLEANSITLSAHVAGTVIYRAKTDITFLPGFETDQAFETEISGTLSSDYTLFQGYHDATFPSMKNEDIDVLTVNYYDNYDFTSRTWDSSYTGLTGGTNAVTPAQHKFVTGMATGSKVLVLNSDNQWLTTIMFYDDRGRVVQTQADNHLGGEDITTSQYDFSGKVLKTHTKHTNPLASTNGTTTNLKQYAYDHAGRLLSIEEKLNGAGSWKRLVTNAYNELGELESKDLGNSSTPLETLDYKYNVRGWLKSINGDYVSSGTGSNFFGMELSYDYGFDTNQLNGNIAGVQWRSKSSAKKKAYGFDYDPVNRLKKADYTQYESSSWLRTTSDFSTTYGYDANGNISALTRKGVVAGSIKTIDDLTYTYMNSGKSNQLDYVNDAVNDLGQGDFTDANEGTDDYYYDANGNMTQDKNKGINGTGDITYNHLNLPVTIEFDNNTSKTITYTYDAAGIKLQKKVNEGGNITTTDYVGGFIYESNQLQQFAHEEGRTRLSGSSLVYDYYIKDHLGNTRMTLTEETGSTLYFASMETEYDSFEESIFLNLDNTRVVSTAGNYTIDVAITANEAARLNGSDANRRVGPGKMLAVSPGDDLDLEVMAYYSGTISGNNAQSEATLTTAVAAAFGGVSVEVQNNKPFMTCLTTQDLLC